MAPGTTICLKKFKIDVKYFSVPYGCLFLGLVDLFFSLWSSEERANEWLWIDILRSLEVFAILLYRQMLPVPGGNEATREQ